MTYRESKFCALGILIAGAAITASQSLWMPAILCGGLVVGLAIHLHSQSVAYLEDIFS